MHYKNRWIYAFAISFVMAGLGFFYGIKNDLHDLIAMQQTERTLKSKFLVSSNSTDLHRLDRSIVRDNRGRFTLETDFLSNVWYSADQSGLTIKSSTYSTAESNLKAEDLAMHVVAEGNFQQLTTFLFALNQKTYTVLITDLLCKAKQQSLTIVMDIILVKMILPDSKDDKPPSQILNPFCLPEGMQVKSNADSLKITPLIQIKMVGHLQQGKRQYALLLLPDNNLISVQPGLVIGKEQAVITQIQSNRILFLLPNHTYFTLNK
jgi:Tfp pilus assembly protein PilO